jgi:hypothetical protein
MRTEPTQITALWRSRARPVLYALTSNLSRLFEVQPGYAGEGSFESQVYDAVTYSNWGRAKWRARTQQAGKVRLFTRTGNTDRADNTWSDWSEANPNVTSPPARFIQWKLVLSATDAKESPVIDGVEIAYLPRNSAPQIESLTLQPPGIMYSNPPAVDMMQQAMPSFPSMGNTGSASAQQPARQSRRTATQMPPRQMLRDGYRTLSWTARDPNDDDLMFSLFIRGDGEKEWRLLKDKIEDNFYSWNTRTMPDGGYYLKLVVSDERSNPPEKAERSERVTERFDIDNTPPAITGIAGEILSGGRVRLRFTATDASTAISEAFFAADGGDPRPILSVDGILDSESENFDVIIPGLSAGEHVISVRVKDSADNSASAKTVITMK